MSTGLKARSLRRIALAAAVILLALAALCILDPHRISLMTLRKVDEFPLYTMRYYDDYHFLQTTGLDEVPGLSSLPAEQSQSFACSAFYGRTPNGDALLGRNFDWEHRSTLLLYTDPPDGYASVSMVDLGYLGFEEGVSRQALENLRQAPFWPFDGMNERGVAVGILAVPPTPGLYDPAKPSLDSLSVIRLILDYAGDLDEALALFQSVNIRFGGGPWLHYLISDRNGSAVVEIVANRVSVIRSQQSWQAVTNFLLTDLSEAEADASCWRYQKASDQLESTRGILEAPQAMSLLRDVSQDSTVWSVVYNLSSGDILIALGRDYDRLHAFNLEHPFRKIR